MILYYLQFVYALCLHYIIFTFIQYDDCTYIQYMHTMFKKVRCVCSMFTAVLYAYQGGTCYLLLIQHDSLQQE